MSEPMSDGRLAEISEAVASEEIGFDYSGVAARALLAEVERLKAEADGLRAALLEARLKGAEGD